jgi:3-oxoadipate CoA-transferase alpha subunit
MINKIANSIADALGDVKDGSTVLLSGFGDAGMAHRLIEGLVVQGARDLTCVCNNAGSNETGLAALLKAGRVRRMICSFPRTTTSHIFDGLFRAGKIELELVPQGTLAERIRAAGAGIGGFYTRTCFGTPLAEGKEVKMIDGEGYVLEAPIHADLALIGAERGDRWGNLVYRLAARNFGPVMATAAKKTVASVREIVELGALDPEHIVTPGIYVHKVVRVPKSLDVPGGAA